MASSLPLSVLAPATIASLAYLNAKWSVSYDWRTFSSTFKFLLSYNARVRNDTVNVFYVLEDHAKDPATRNRIFVLFEGREYTYKEAYELVLRYGQWFKREHGVVQDEIVAMAFTNKPEFLWLAFGLWSIGAKPAFINHNLTNKALTHCVRVSTSRLLVVDDDVRENVNREVMDELSSPDFHEEGLGPIKVCFFDNDTHQKVLKLDPKREPNSHRSVKDPSEVAVLIYTSGTTGLPKAAIVPWARTQRAMAFFSYWLGFTKDDRFYTAMPLYHSAAFVLGACNVLNTGCTLVLSRKFTARNFWTECRETKATVIQYVGETLRYLLATAPGPDDRNHNVRLAYGNGLRPDIWNQFKERFGVQSIAEFYAATEGVGGTLNYSSNDFSAGAVGRSGSLVRAMLGGGSAIIKLDPETDEPLRDPKTGFCTEADSSKGESGESMAKLDENNIKASYTGYWRNDKASNSKVMRNVLKKGDAWYRTGDVLRTDTEGRTYFVDRIGDTFRWKSENVSTSEVSEALSGHSAVAEANVYGVALPGHDGRAGCAATVLKEGVTINNEVLASIGSHVTESLPSYARPIFLRVTKQLEATGTNKYMKSTLRQEGVEHSKVTPSGDILLWLRDGVYVPFSEGDLTDIRSGRVRL